MGKYQFGKVGSFLACHSVSTWSLKWEKKKIEAKSNGVSESSNPSFLPDLWRELDGYDDEGCRL